MGQVINFEIGEEQVPFTLQYTENAQPKTGLTIWAMLRRTSDNKYLDFNDNTWKSAGWIQKYLTLNDLGGGTYQKLWNSKTAITGETITVAEYEATTAGYEGVDNDILLFGVSSFNPGDVWEELTAAHTNPGTYGLEVNEIYRIVEIIRQIEMGRWRLTADNKLRLYEEDNNTLIAEFDTFNLDTQPAIRNVTDRIRVGP